MKFEFVEIEKIDSYSVDEEIVYDLTVEDNHSYCVDDNIVVHNSLCQTRMKTGVGYPQLSAILECKDAAHGLGGLICADGGIRNAGDVAKAFGAGADFCMVCSMFMGCDECEGEWVYDDSRASTNIRYNIRRVSKKEYCEFYNKTPKNDIDREYYIEEPIIEVHGRIKTKLKCYGMSSHEAQKKYLGEIQKHRASEGDCKYFDYKGKSEDVLDDIIGGVVSACSYVGARRLKDFDKCCTFVRVNRIHT